MTFTPVPEVNPESEREACLNLKDGKVAWLVVSGKMTSGKDTIAPLLAPLLPGKVYLPRYGNLMRAELDPILDIMRQNEGSTKEQLVDLLYPEANLTEPRLRELIGVLGPELLESDFTLTAHSRTVGVRYVLQQLGDTWRCENDRGYWARRAVVDAVQALAAGESVITTGGRFAPDVELPAERGAVILRLDVTRETQLARLTDRDGLAPSPEVLLALDHSGEVALDDWKGFHVRVDNDGTLAEVLIKLEKLVPPAIQEARRAAKEHLEQLPK
jgi:hypothetical protein